MRGRLAQRLGQMREGGAVIELHEIDATDIVEVARVLIVGAVLGEVDIQAELVGEAELVGGEVIAQNQIDQHGLKWKGHRGNVPKNRVSIFEDQKTWSQIRK